MRKTYVTRMPDKAGAFLLASRIIAACGGNIARVNYNRAVDTHTLFIEVSATAAQHAEIARQLSECGYLTELEDGKRILMIVLTLSDHPGAVTPVLEVLSRHSVNISYISSQENGTGVQHFKMGLLIENTGEIKRLIDEISRVCEISILNYEVTDRLLDGTVFYITFANEMREILSLSQAQTNAVLIQANKLMQLLDEQDKPALQTFDYIRRFAQFVVEHRGAAFNAQVSTLRLADGLILTAIEPPCGSNTYVLEYHGELLCVDSGFACYREEMLRLLEGLFPRFSLRRKEAWLTHADVDHAGLLSLFDSVYMSQNCYDNFALERRGAANFREQNPLHAPYCVLSKVISDYEPPELRAARSWGQSATTRRFPTSVPARSGVDVRLLRGERRACQGRDGDRLRKAAAFVQRRYLRKHQGLFPDQQEFNRLAPFLMTGVDSDPARARESRALLTQTYAGYLCCPGHGRPAVAGSAGGRRYREYVANVRPMSRGRAFCVPFRLERGEGTDGGKPTSRGLPPEVPAVPAAGAAADTWRTPAP